MLQHGEPQRGAAVEEDVAGAEDEDDLVQRRIRLDGDPADELRAEEDAGEEVDRHVRHLQAPRGEPRQRPGRENHAKDQQHVFRGLQGGVGLQARAILYPGISQGGMPLLFPLL